MISEISFSELLKNSWPTSHPQTIHIEVAQVEQREGG